ncbi:hypothetical protein COCNU_03G000220 [Cocos nucifera]|uniref:Uncharacterized protein n=1 Tax=Cocos nucifera TaxID=13894 RepID=A0A8K0I1B9_COCNU|nr:hypothetical protein COCNU_03G000220 [Cocos nucifera]
MGILKGKVAYEKTAADIQQEKNVKLERELVVAIATRRVAKVELIASKEKATKDKSLAVEVKLQALVEYKISEHSRWRS